MKFGIRTPNLKKSIKARTTGKLKRQVKKAVIPYYGKKGTGVFKDPKKAVYNKIYNKTTIDSLKGAKKSLSITTNAKPNTPKDEYIDINLNDGIPRLVNVRSNKGITLSLTAAIVMFFVGFYQPIWFLFAAVSLGLYIYFGFISSDVKLSNYYTSAVYFIRIGKIDEARNKIKLALELKPGHVDVLALQEYLNHMEKGRNEEE